MQPREMNRKVMIHEIKLKQKQMPEYSVTVLTYTNYLLFGLLGLLYFLKRRNASPTLASAIIQMTTLVLSAGAILSCARTSSARSQSPKH